MRTSDFGIDLDYSFQRLLPSLGQPWTPAAVPDPVLVAANDSLAEDLGITTAWMHSPEAAQVFAGNQVPDGATPFAMAYAGHQFGNYSPRLGDGRALLLGEIIDRHGRRRDLHLKGSGRTPFARGGDGKATIGPMLREFLIAEAMHALCIPTTRALAVVTTGESIRRNEMEPGAVLTRVAASHLRVGTFEYAARLEDRDVIRQLADLAIDRHHPAAADEPSPYLALLAAVVDAQALLVAHWMLVGFIHGVMNTDNVTISGEGIDYGPCAFMDQYDPGTVFSSIDRGGRYAYGNQPDIAQWNLARLGETLLPLIDPDADAAIALATTALEQFPGRFRHHLDRGMRAKLGLSIDPGRSPDEYSDLFDSLIGLQQADRADHTLSYRALSASLRGDDSRLRELFKDQGRLAAWLTDWRSALDASGRSVDAAADDMDRVNPLYIPRNHLVDDALRSATAGDLKPFDDLLRMVTAPYIERDGDDRFAQPAPDGFGDRFQTFCGT